MPHNRVLRHLRSRTLSVGHSILTQIHITWFCNTHYKLLVPLSEVHSLFLVVALNLSDLVGHHYWDIPSSWCAESYAVHASLNGKLHGIVIELLHCGAEWSCGLLTRFRLDRPAQVDLFEWFHACDVWSHSPASLYSPWVLVVARLLVQSLNLLLLETDELVYVLVNFLQTKLFVKWWLITSTTRYVYALVTSLGSLTLRLSLLAHWWWPLVQQVSVTVVTTHYFVDGLLFYLAESLDMFSVWH